MEQEQDFTYDPFQLQNAPTKQRFSIQEKAMAVILVLIFMMIPLYTISSDAFKANYVYKQEPSYGCGLYYIENNPYTPLEYKQAD